MIYFVVRKVLLKFNCTRNSITSSLGVTTFLSVKESQLLHHLLINGHNIIPRTEIMSVLNFDPDDDYQLLNSTIHGLRKKLAELVKCPIVITIRGTGYILSNDVVLKNRSIRHIFYSSLIAFIFTILLYTGYSHERWNHYFYLLNEESDNLTFHGVYEVYCHIDGTRKSVLFTKPTLVSSYVKDKCSKERYIEVIFKSEPKKITKAL
jgi:DNA-binding winged helix-turn-helix (wHTH) protein